MIHVHRAYCSAYLIKMIFLVCKITRQNSIKNKIENLLNFIYTLYNINGNPKLELKYKSNLTNHDFIWISQTEQILDYKFYTQAFRALRVPFLVTILVVNRCSSSCHFSLEAEFKGIFCAFSKIMMVDMFFRAKIVIIHKPYLG